jgi:hypothetical protein
MTNLFLLPLLVHWKCMGGTFKIDFERVARAVDIIL